ncbi:signal transducer and activator of transcription 4 [Vanacampus margaritifer]
MTPKGRADQVPRMSQWKQIQQLEMRLLEQVDYLYDDNFPMDIRQGLAIWIEDQDWDTAADIDSMAAVLFSNLLSQLELALSQEQNFLQRHNMKIIQQQLQMKYASNPAAMASVISNCLKEERRILSIACMQQQQVPLEKSLDLVTLERQKNMDQRIGMIWTNVQMMDQGVKYIENMQEDFDFRYKTLQSRDPSERNSEFMKQEVTRLQEILNRLDFKRKEILSKMAVVIQEIDDLMNSQLYVELHDWKRKQQMAAIGSPTLSSLDQLQSWFTQTAQSLFQVKRQLDKLGELVLKVTYESDPIPVQKPQMEEHVKYLIHHIIKSSFVVEKQPCMLTHPQKPLVIKTKVQFSTKIKLLVKLPAIDYQIKVKTTFDKELPTGRVNRQFFIVNNTSKVMDIEDYSNGCLSAEFKHGLSEKKYGNSTKGNESLLPVTEELHSLSFEAHFTMHGLNIDLETCSLPLVVISNASQIPAAWASVMWYNLLNNEPKNLAFFSSSLRATWAQLSEVLSWQFSTNSVQGLNKEQLNMLGEKLLGQHFRNSDQISWSKFSKENIPGKQFSFWIWLDSILELIRKHLLPVWNKNYIMGFVSKEMERALLREKSSGTFLLRFSESHLGGITFTWVQHSDNGEPTFNSVEPYTKSRLNALHFPDIIRDYKMISDGVVPKNPLKFLYPDIPKDEAFGQLYNNLPSKVYPYIPSTLIPCSEMRSHVRTPSPPCDSPEPPMTPGEFEMLCFDMDIMNPPRPGNSGSVGIAPASSFFLFLFLGCVSLLFGIHKTLFDNLSDTEIVCPAEEEMSTQLDSKIAHLKKMSQDVSNEIGSLERLREKLSFIHAEQRHTQDVAGPDNFYVQTNQILLKQIHSMLTMAEDVVQTLTTVELHKWKRRQQLACIGSPNDTCLDCLQKSFTTVAVVLQQINHHLTKLPEPNGNCNHTGGNPVAESKTFSHSLMTQLLSNALVVEKQPAMSGMPLVLRTKAKFTVRLRFLVNLPEFRCLLKVKPVFDKDVAEKNKRDGFRHIDFSVGSNKVLDADITGNCLVAEFDDLIIQEIKKRALGSNGSPLIVTEELHVITFVTDFLHAGLRCHIEASSLPVVVTTAAAQGPNAWASVMWYNMSASQPMNLRFFFKPPPLSWFELSQVLSWQFLSVGKRPLDENQVAMLRDKIVEDPDGFVHWNSFSKGNVWLWLNGILNLIKKHLVELWRDGLIMGFVSRRKIKELLQEKKTGTFLLRFSETNQNGAISFSWVDHHNGEVQEHSIEPYTKLELATTPMANVICDFSPRVHGSVSANPLLYLYPDVDRDAAFKRYYICSDKQRPASASGYVRRKSISVIDLPTPPPSPPQDLHMADMFHSMPGMLDVFCPQMDVSDVPDLLFSEQHQVGGFDLI